MKLDKPSTALVIVGGWNRYIFTPDWVKRYLFPGERENFTVELMVAQDFNAQLVSPRIVSKQVEILFQENKLNFIPVENKNENYDRIQTLALQLADYLPHTPVTAYGVNFLFTENSISEDLLNLIRSRDLTEIQKCGASLTNERYSRRLVLNERILNMNIIFQGEKAAFDLNFHFNIGNLVEFKAGISETSILKLKQEATRFLTNVYDLEIEGESE